MASQQVNAPKPAWSCTSAFHLSRPTERLQSGVATPLHGVEHYENFPVASWLMPARLRPAVIAIYRFARHADDIADEGDASDDARLTALAALEVDIRLARAGEAPQSTWVAGLVPHVAAHRLDWSRFEALLSAFRQDVETHRYADFATLLDYCGRSADPVGQLILALSGHLTDENRALSDQICSALQLINFLQDAAIDWRRGRLYLPLESLARHGLTEADVDLAATRHQAGQALRDCIAHEAQRAQAMLARGAPLASRTGGRLGWELRAIVAGGQRILLKLAAGGHDPFVRRPALERKDALPLALAIARLALRPAPSTLPFSTHPHQ
jgi:squalene synthase HpnC